MINIIDMAGLQIRPASFNDIPFIQQIAEETWPAAYSQILSGGQLRYMLDLFYSTASLENQMADNHYYFIAFQEFTPVGFAAFSQIEQQVYKLQKIYVLPGIQRLGAGKALLKVVEETAKSMGGIRLQLNVNRQNKASDFYQKNDFKIIKQEDIDIGRGYFMNDFIMEKLL